MRMRHLGEVLGVTAALLFARASHAQPVALGGPPAPYVYEPAPAPVHAPEFSLWAGARLGVGGFIHGSFFENEQNRSETVGNFAGSGLTGEANVGARLGRRYVPYLFWEHLLLSQGHRFEGADATSSSDFRGLGLRLLSGNVDTAAFVWDLALGIRSVTVSSGSQSYTMSSFEFGRLGLGAEIRLSTLVTISPLVTLSTGRMTEAEGDVAYSAGGSKDGILHPTYRNGAQISESNYYAVLSLTCGGHFDFLGK